MQIIGHRGDVSFVRQLVRKIGAEPTAVVRTNLRRIENLPWIATNVSILDALREGEQPGAVHLAVMSSTSRFDAFDVVAYVLRHGKVAGRRIAAAALAEFVGPPANDLAVKLLDDDDPAVRAAAARQLRERNLPGAIQRLLTLLESPHIAEREAAQAGLIEFTLDRYSANFEAMTPEARLAAGVFVRRVDPHAIDRVGRELDAPTRSRRKRALELTIALDAVRHLQEQIVALLKDDDQYLRIDAIRALAVVDNPLTRQTLRDALLDAHPLVQRAAEAALSDLTQRDTAPAVIDSSRDTVRLVNPQLTSAPDLSEVAQ
jgi:HEAT repeat protein